jgi:hypothetical protein
VLVVDVGGVRALAQQARIRGPCTVRGLERRPWEVLPEIVLPALRGPFAASLFPSLPGRTSGSTSVACFGLVDLSAHGSRPEDVIRSASPAVQSARPGPGLPVRRADSRAAVDVTALHDASGEPEVGVVAQRSRRYARARRAPRCRRRPSQQPDPPEARRVMMLISVTALAAPQRPPGQPGYLDPVDVLDATSRMSQTLRRTGAK